MSKDYGNRGGAIRFFVACSNAYANAINLGSLHAVPVKLTLKGTGFGSNPVGNPAAFTGTKPYGTVTVGYPGRAAMPGYFGILNDRDILDVVAYLRTFR